MPPNIYVLGNYANSSNLKHERYETEHITKVRFSNDSLIIELSESNSLVEERYCLNIKSAKFIIEGTMNQNEIKEAMVHHHPYGHPWKHLQFKIYGKNEVIRINLEPLDEEDYINCIKGFLHISKDIIDIEEKENKISTNLTSYFFNSALEELMPFRKYLLRKIKTAYDSEQVLNDSNTPINSKQLGELKAEKILLPFFNWA